MKLIPKWQAELLAWIKCSKVEVPNVRPVFEVVGQGLAFGYVARIFDDFEDEVDGEVEGVACWKPGGGVFADLFVFPPEFVVVLQVSGLGLE